MYVLCDASERAYYGAGSLRVSTKSNVIVNDISQITQLKHWKYVKTGQNPAEPET